MMLPDELEWVLQMLGYNWPTANEDLLRESAVLWRKFGDDAQKLRVRADTSAGTVVAHNEGESIDKFRAHYKKFSDGQDGYLANAAEAAYIIANTFEAAAYLVEFAKYAVIVQLIALAVQIAAAAAASVVTFGLSAAAGMAATQVTRLAVRRILDALKDALMEAIIEAMKEPAVSAVQAMVTDLVTQSVNVGFGTQEGFDLGKTVKAGAQGGWEAIKQTPQTLAEGLRDGLGKKAGSSIRDGIDSGYNNSMDAYNNRNNPTTGSGDGGDGDSSGSGSSGSASSSSDSSNSSTSANSSASNSSGTASSSSSSNSSNSSGTSGSSNNSSSSSGSDSSTTSPSNTNTGNTNIGGGISADGDGPAAYSAPDLAGPPSTDTGTGSGTPDSSPGAPDSGQNPSSSNSPSRPTLSDFDDPAPGNTPPSPSPAPDTGGSTPGTGDTRGGSFSGGLSAPTPQSAPTPTGGGTSSSTPSGGGISTSIDSLAASIPTQSNAAPTPTTADPSTAGPRPDGNSSMPTSPAPTSPAPTSTADGAAGARTGTSTTPGGSPSSTSPTSPNPSQNTPRTPTTTPGIPNPTATGPAPTPSPTPSTPPRTPTPSADVRTPGTPETRTPNPNQPAPGATPGRTPNPSTPSSTPTFTPGAVTTPSSGTPGSADTRTPPTNTNPASTTPHTSHPEPTTPSQDPRQPAPTRTAQSPAGTPAATPSPNASDSPAPGRTPDRAPTPNNSAPSTPSAPNTPNTPNQPGATPGPTPGNKPQQPGSQPHTPQNTHPSPAHTPNTPDTPNQQQPQVTVVPIHTVTPAPNGHTAQPTPQAPHTTPPTQQQGQDNTTKPTTPTPASATRNTTPPGGVTDPTRAEQDALDNSVPRDENGDPTRPPDPQDGPWVQNINGTGPDTPGRNNNCVDVALSTVDTYAGNPTAAAARTPDADADGNPSDRGEKGGRDRIENTLGARFSDLGNGPDAFNRLENTLRNSGHGSQAVIITQDANGRAHAWNAVNHNGRITYIDAQTGRTSPDPLHSGNNGVFAIPLDANRQPVSPSTGDHSRPDSERPDRRVPETGGNADRRPPEDPAGPNPASDPKDPDQRPYTDPKDRGTSDTVQQGHDVTRDGPEKDTSRTLDNEGTHSREYGLEPDARQRELRSNRDVHRIELDRVHDNLDRWAGSGHLASVLQATAGASSHPDDSNRPRSFTRSQLSERLPGFDRLSPGEQQAVVASLARLSLSFHRQHGVGNNPEHIKEPYRQPGEPDPGPKTPDRNAKKATGSLGVKLHQKFGKNFVKQLIKDRAKEGNELSQTQAATARRHSPDFSDKNFAVLEVQGTAPDNEVIYVVDSSVPANESGVTPRHSEKHLLEWLKRADADGTKYTPLGLYTEREPCGEGQGHAKCSDTLQDQQLGKIPINYSATYRTDPQGPMDRDAVTDQRDDQLDSWSDRPVQEVKEELERRLREKYVPHSDRLPKKLDLVNNMSESQAREALATAITNEYKKIRDETRTHKEQAMAAEMTRHVDVLRRTWDKVLPQLI
ncbi:toxin glutamine deamidase domain-containing protein [Streptomyces sp. Wb2n-11]|uniref:toxin glutamine deamidase domain-containing protein n=1 Tax=Streptomyces sp. Wb2n-11 TaxID=1030533 RepID=UPI000A664D66|nr:toxin glutamine deamidase domain-containing protein [Streptomyces sp. Wb2n-11]